MMDETLQLISDQLMKVKNEIYTITSQLKTELCALGTGKKTLKSDIDSIIKDKVGNCMRSNTEGLKAEMKHLRS
jgi:hypothetical protein